MEDYLTVDPEIIEIASNIAREYEYMRGSVQEGYRYMPHKEGEKYLKKAAKFCKEHEIDPAIYILGAMQSLGNARDKFYINYIGSPRANQGASDCAASNQIPYERVLEQQVDLLRTHITRLKKPYLEVLLDPRLKFYAWFRILITECYEPEITKRYLHIAKLEMNKKLIVFLQEKNLPIDRILES
jgi:hypothetical protein